MKERIVIYVSPVTLERLELLRGWAGARSRGEVIEAAVSELIQKHEDEILRWTENQLQVREGEK